MGKQLFIDKLRRDKSGLFMDDLSYNNFISFITFFFREAKDFNDICFIEHLFHENIQKCSRVAWSRITGLRPDLEGQQNEDNLIIVLEENKES